jgi:hypothetical protein
MVQGLCAQAGEDDGSYFTRPMTEAELREQAAAAEAAAAH